MSDNKFFKPTVLYKEYMILDMIEKNSNITQREMSRAIGIAVSTVNDYLDKIERDNLIKRKKHTTKTVEYFGTKKGIERVRLLNILYLSQSQKMYNFAKQSISKHISDIMKNKYSTGILYGAGEVAELILSATFSMEELNFKITSIIDDNPNKVGTNLSGIEIISIEQLAKMNYDFIFISTIRNNKQIIDNLLEYKVNRSNIISFFEEN